VRHLRCFVSQTWPGLQTVRSDGTFAQGSARGVKEPAPSARAATSAAVAGCEGEQG
jgi:hypothetical protein